MLGLPLFVYLPTFYNETLGLSLTAVGFALLLARSLDVVTDPLIGLLNDRFTLFSSKHDNSVKWRRKSFMLAGVPILLIGLIFLLKPESDVSVTYLFLWSFITYLGWTLINIPWLAWGAEISPDYHEKSSLASSREIFSVIGTVLVISLPVILSMQSDLRLTLATLADLLFWLVPVSLVPLLWNLSDKPPIDLITSKPEKITKDVHKSSWKQVISVASHPAVKKLLPAYFANSFANALPATLFILFVGHVLKMPDQVGVLLLSYFLSAIAGLPLWLYVARKTDKHISWSIALVVSIGAFIWVPFLGVGDFTLFLVICLVSGFALGADVVLPASIQADITQKLNSDRKLKNTERTQAQDSTGLLFGLWGLLTKLSLALAVGIAFPLLGFVGFKSTELNPQGINTLVILYALVPIILKSWVIFQMWKYPFGKAYFTDDFKTPPQNENSTEKISYKRKGKQNENFNSTANVSYASANTTFKRM
jgi:Na+/melibiose symporter-like transporter